MEQKGEFWVHVQQPTVPQYRLAFFDAVAERLGRKLRVLASHTVPDGPTSVAEPRDYLDLGHPCSEFLGGRAFWQSAMRPALGAGRGDVAVFNGNPRFLSSLWFANAARRRGMGLVWWGHGWSPTSRRWSTRVREFLMHGVDAVLLYTENEAAEWRARLPASVGVFAAQNAIDQSRTRSELTRWAPDRLDAFRREHAIEGRTVLLFCGRLRASPRTDLDLLLQALRVLVASDKSYLAVIIGDGDDRQRLHSVAQALGVEAHVRWLGARYDESANAPWFLSALCFVYPGSIGLSLLHAMGYGLPVVTHGNRRRHNPEIAALRDGWNGLEFADGDAGDLARAIGAIAENPASRAAMSVNARTTVMVEFNIDQMADRFCAAVMYARRSAVDAVPA